MYTERKKRRKSASASALCAFDSAEECISLRQLWLAVHAPSPLSHPWEFNLCKSDFPCVLTGGRGEKMTQQDHLIYQFSTNLFANTNTYGGSFQRGTVLPANKMLLRVRARKGPCWKITVGINKAIFCRVSGWRSGYLLWGAEDR